MNYTLAIIGLMFCLSAQAQLDNKNNKGSKPLFRQLSFHSVNQAGIIEGEKGTSFLMQTVNGLEKNYWFAGIGAGIDYYFQRTVPVFIDIRRSLLKKDKSPFIYADAGISFPWAKKNNDNAWYKEEYKNGHYYDLGLGYNVPVSKAGTIVFSLGYTEKKLQKEMYTYNYLIYSGIYDGTTNKSEFNYRLRRISVKVGWKF